MREQAEKERAFSSLPDPQVKRQTDYSVDLNLNQNLGGNVTQASIADSKDTVAAEIAQKESIIKSINTQLESKGGSTKLSLAARIGLSTFKKSIRAQQSDLQKEKGQLKSIQIDLGVDLMTGNVLREKVSHTFVSKRDFQKTIEVLAQYTYEQRTTKQVEELSKIVRKMQFFRE